MKKAILVFCIVILLLPQVTVAEKTWICPECGYRVAESLGDICLNCGASRLTPTPTPATTPPPSTPTPTPAPTSTPKSKPRVGEIITFGTYPQTESGKKKPIEWIVLDVQGS